MNINWDSTITLGILLAVFLLIFKAGGWYNGVNDRMKNLDDKISDGMKNLDDKINDGMKNLDDKINDGIKNLDDKINNLTMMFDNYLFGQRRLPFESQSPIRLNEWGHELSKDINADDLAKKYLPNIQINADENEYRIQQRCFEYAHNILPEVINDEERNNLEQMSFNHGVPMEIFLRVIGLVFRDAKFNELGRNTVHSDEHGSNKAKARTKPKKVSKA